MATTNATDEGILTNISEMIDLAIGTPEVGVVDFSMLQTVLHCLAQQMRVLGKNVELRGSFAVLPVGRSDNSQTIAISEFIVDTGSPGKYNLATEPPTPEQESVLVVERKRKSAPQAIYTMTGDKSTQRRPSKEPTTAPSVPTSGTTGPASGTTAPTSGTTAPTSGTTAPTSDTTAAPTSGTTAPTSGTTAPTSGTTAPTSGTTGPTSGTTAPTSVTLTPTHPTAAPTPITAVTSASPASPSIVQVPQRITAPSTITAPSAEKLSLVTLSKFNLLENTVADLKDRVYGTSPKNEEIIQEVRSQGNLKAITDMWTNMNVESRLDAAEAGISKLSSLIEDLIGETAEIQRKLSSQPSAATLRMAKAANELSKAAIVPAAPSAPVQGGPSMEEIVRLIQKDFATKDELKQLLDHLQAMRNDLDNLTKTFSDAMTEVNPNFVPTEIPPPSKIELKAPEVVVVPPQVVPSYVPPPPPPPPPPPGNISVADTSHIQGNLNQVEARLLEKLANLEKELKKCCDSFKKSDGVVHDQLTSFQDQLEYMGKQIASLSIQGEGGKLSPDLVKDLQGLMKLFETVQNMQRQLQQVHETALNLAAEKEDRQNHIDALLEQIELLKVIKLDREDMVEALADKADLRMLARKVSHDQFENACDDLSKGLEHALGKLNVQESLWQQALDDIQREIEQKLDKLELSPVKDFFNNKLKQLQENLKQMASLRREAEAAGTKRRLLRDVNCISCDAKAVMGMDPLPPQPSKPLPATLSMKPYLSYELDTIRKNQASSLPQRNMHDWEHVQHQMQPKPHKVRSETDKHLCNRYCGGSHTVTTPAQRVARLGHFIKQWGPEVLPLSSGFAAGDDGRLYKISTSEGANVGPGGAVEGAAVCTPKSPVKKAEPPKSPKPLYISAECRCLDPTADHPPPKN